MVNTCSKPSGLLLNFHPSMLIEVFDPQKNGIVNRRSFVVSCTVISLRFFYRLGLMVPISALRLLFSKRKKTVHFVIIVSNRFALPIQRKDTEEKSLREFKSFAPHKNIFCPPTYFFAVREVYHVHFRSSIQ